MASSTFTLDKLPANLKQYTRSAWLPVVRQGDGVLTDSKFSGMPWLGPNQNWPVCPECAKPMQLFLQLNLDTLPEHNDHGLLQLFYCTYTDDADHADCESFTPFSRYTIVRVVSPKGKHNAKVSLPEGAFPAVTIIGWKPFDDFPQAQELEAMGVNVSPELDQELADSDYPGQGDKLSGWPDWIQGVEYPYCPVCGAKMLHLFQLTSEEHIPFAFGDEGTGHITQCPVHADVVAFGWACT